MKLFLQKNNRGIEILFLVVVIFLAVLFFRESFTNFFYADDFFHICLTRSQSLLSAFNLFHKAILGYYIYRPLSTQVYWWLGTWLFALRPLGYHVFYYLFFVINILLIWKIAKLLTGSKFVSGLTVIIYCFSSNHFYRLFFLSTFQEVLMTTFILFALLFYVRNSRWVILAFFLALLSKETSIMLPFLLLIYEIIYRKIKNYRILIVLFIIAIIYFIGRKYFFGFYSGGEYYFDFNLIKVINNYFWYLFWTLGLPEHYMNLKIFVPGTIVNPKLFTDFGRDGWSIITLFISMLVSFIWLILNIFRKDVNLRVIVIGVSIFLLFILPVGFFPFHKFASSLTLPLFGFSIVFAVLLSRLKFPLILVVLVIYFSLSTYAYNFALHTHWNTRRALIASKTLEYFRRNFSSNISNYSNIYFIGKGYSKELAFSLSGPYGLMVLYNDLNLKVYYEDLDNREHLNDKSLIVDSRLFVSDL